MRRCAAALIWLAFPIGATAATAEPAKVIAPVAASTIVSIEQALAASQLELAASLIERAAGVLPSMQLRLVRAEYALARDDVDSAMTDFTAVVGDASVAARAHLGIGLIELRHGHDPLAITSLDLALAIDPSLVRGWIARGVAADRTRDWPLADIAYARALALDPRSTAALIDRGYSKLLRGQFAEAAADSAMALAIDPKSTTATNNLRLARAMQGDYKTAFAGSTKASLANDLNTVGFAAMSRGDYGLAETFFTRAMRVSPQFDRTAWDNLVYLKQLAHKPPETISQR